MKSNTNNEKHHKLMSLRGKSFSCHLYRFSNNNNPEFLSPTTVPHSAPEDISTLKKMTGSVLKERQNSTLREDRTRPSLQAALR